MSRVNRRVRLARRPQGLPRASDWNIVDEPIPDLKEGEVLIGNIYLSLDPAMRGWIREGKSYIDPVEVGAVMRCLSLGKVVSSKHKLYQEGTYLTGLTGVQQFAISDGTGLSIVPEQANLTTFLNILGMPGMTAYFAFLEVGKPRAGDTVLVSGAAGAVGSLVGQLAKIKECRVVGIAGGEEKCRYLKELGFDDTIDYKNEDLADALSRTCPKGVDLFFDNVGGEMLDTVLTRIRKNARIVICGAISQYNKEKEEVYGLKNCLSLLVNRARMEGMIVFDYVRKYPQAVKDLSHWMKTGALKSREHIDQGIDQFPVSLLKLFSGKHAGKLILQVGEHPSRS